MEKWIIFILIVLVIVLLVRFVHLKNEQTKLNSLWYLLENATDVIYSIRIDDKIRYEYLSSSLEMHLGKQEAAKHRKDPMYLVDSIHPDDAQIINKKLKGELDFSVPHYFRVKTDSGEYIWFEEFITPLYEDNRLVQMYAIFRNCHDQKVNQLQLEKKATMDALEGIYNRSYFDKKMQEYNEKEESPIGLFIFDIDKLKVINDIHGHIEGDKIIALTAQILLAVFPKEAIICRIGGDEFAVFLPNIAKDTRKYYSDKIKNEIEKISLNNQIDNLSISFGYSYSDITLMNMDKLYREADKSMYINKKQ